METADISHTCCLLLGIYNATQRNDDDDGDDGFQGIVSDEYKDRPTEKISSQHAAVPAGRYTIQDRFQNDRLVTRRVVQLHLASS